MEPEPEAETSAATETSLGNTGQQMQEPRSAASTTRPQQSCLLTFSTALEHLKANKVDHLVPTTKVPDQRYFDILPAIGTARVANPNFTVPVIQLPSANLPGRFADEGCWKSVTRKKQHPMYSTTSHEIGLRPPSLAQLPSKWFAQSGTFSKEFANANRFNELRNMSTLTTAMTRSKVHHSFDQGWRGDAHSLMLYASTGPLRKLGSEQRVF